MARRNSSRKRRPRRAVQLGLSARGRRGGMRAGAGRKRIPRHKRSYVPHIRRPKVTKSTPVHVTLRCVAGLPSLRRANPRRIIEFVFGKENRRGFRLVHYSIQGNHLHLICEGRDTQALSRGVQRVSSMIARKLNRHFDRRGSLFKGRFHGVVIKTPRQMRNALRYVLLNHHKHQAEAKLAVFPRDASVEGFDAFSSARYFDGWRRPAARCRPPPEGAPVVTPKSWLINKGWRRHGLIRALWM
jgi:REP element-mobilizing transposase RayT